MQMENQVRREPSHSEWKALRERCGLARLPERALLRVAGADSTRWLNGMLTNSVIALQPGEGAYNFALNAQGRIQGDCTLYRESTPAEPASFLLSTTRTQADILQPWLERYIIMDDVELSSTAAEDESLLLAGPAVASTLRELGLPAPEPLRLVRAQLSLGAVQLLTPLPSLVPRVELRAAAATLRSLEGALLEAGAVALSAETLEAWRVLESIPLFGRDIRDRDLPQETGQAHALHFNKGCYLGQEIVERIRSRGQVHRLFTAFELTGTLPESLPTSLEAEGKHVGDLTSAAEILTPAGVSLRAIGYIRREALLSGLPLTYAGGRATQHKDSVPST